MPVGSRPPARGDSASPCSCARWRRCCSCRSRRRRAPPTPTATGSRNRFEKRQSHTNPRKADTDGDGLGDKYELRRAHTNPRKRDTRPGRPVRRLRGERLEDLAAPEGHRPRRALGRLRGQALEDLAAPEGHRRRRSLGRLRGQAVRHLAAAAPTTTATASRTAWRCSSAWTRTPARATARGSPVPIRARRTTRRPPTIRRRLTTRTIPRIPTTLAPNTSLGGAAHAGRVATGSATFSFASSEPGLELPVPARRRRVEPVRLAEELLVARRRARTPSTCAPSTRPATRIRRPAQRTWTIDLPPLPDIIPPNTSLGSGGPSGIVTTGSASFTFTSSEAGSTFQCRLDAGAWGACASPKAYSGLGEGSHNFYVRARDAAGNLDLTPAQRTWTVDFPAPRRRLRRRRPDPPTCSSRHRAATRMPCTSAAPCRSLARGYAVAAAGDVIGVAAGSYPSQTVPGGLEGRRLQGHRAAEAPPARQRGLERGVRRVRRGRRVHDGAHVPQQREQLDVQERPRSAT